MNESILNINNTPNDQYACPFEKCDLVPEIMNVDFLSGKIQIKCRDHGNGINEMEIKNYFEGESQNLYYKIKCCRCPSNQSESLNNFIFNYNNGYNYCKLCTKDQFFEKTRLIKVNELSTKCKSHFENFNRYCLYCKQHFCAKCEDKCQNHKDKVKTLEKAKNNDLDKIKEKIAQLIKKKELEELLIKLLKTIIETFENHKNNYYHILNIKNISESIIEENEDSKFEKYQKMLKEKDEKIKETLNEIKDLKEKNIRINENNIIKAEKNLTFLENKILDFFNQKLKLEVKLEKNLVIIDLNNKNIGDFELELLTGVSFPYLKELNLSHNKIASVSPLINLESKKLKKLDLSFNNIEGINDIKKLVKKFEFTLKEINLDQNKILSKDIEYIKQLLKFEYRKECCLIYKLDNPDKKIRLFSEYFFKNNQDKCKIKDGEKQVDLSEFYDYQNKKIKINSDYEITLILKDDIENISKMFANCKELKKISKIFHINSDSKIKDISEMFYGCSSLIFLPDSISQWDTSNITDISGLFYGCSKLEKLPDLSKWKTKNVTNMMSLFNGCVSLISLPGISLWDTSKVSNMSCIFSDCYSLSTISDIHKWITSNVTNMSDMFNGCKKLKDLSSLSNWNTSRVTTMKNMFKSCTSLSKRPDIRKWNMDNVTDKRDMFSKCPPEKKNN